MRFGDKTTTGGREVKKKAFTVRFCLENSVQSGILYQEEEEEERIGTVAGS